MNTARILSAALTLALLAGASQLAAEEKGDKAPDQAKLFKKFEESMKGVKLVGHFTIDGKDDMQRHEEYTIESIEHGDGDLWKITAKIKYGKVDASVTLPPIPVKWAGDTPIITLSNVTIPTLGTFGARVMIFEGKYAGTWKHGDVGGLMYGNLEKIEAEKKE